MDFYSDHHLWMSENAKRFDELMNEPALAAPAQPCSHDVPRGDCHKELFATALSRSTKMKAAYEARLKKRKAARAAV